MANMSGGPIGDVDVFTVDDVEGEEESEEEEDKEESEDEEAEPEVEEATRLDNAPVGFRALSVGRSKGSITLRASISFKNRCSSTGSGCKERSGKPTLQRKSKQKPSSAFFHNKAERVWFHRGEK
jgi:hypothetical protein